MKAAASNSLEHISMACSELLPLLRVKVTPVFRSAERNSSSGCGPGSSSSEQQHEEHVLRPDVPIVHNIAT